MAADEVMTNKEMIEKLKEMRAFHASQVQALDLAIREVEGWEEIKETVVEMRDNDGTGTQQEACKFLANLMGVIEKEGE